MLFDIEANYMASIESDMTRSQGATTTTVQFDAEWTRSIPGQPATRGPAPKAGGGDGPTVQAIDDPCDDNYVGPEECLDSCSVNYMGDEACAEDGAPAPADGDPETDPPADADPDGGGGGDPS